MHAQIRKLIEVLKEHGTKDKKGRCTMKFGPLFELTQDVFEALSGTLKTAKKHKVVKYDGELLLQGKTSKCAPVLSAWPRVSSACACSTALHALPPLISGQ